MYACKRQRRIRINIFSVNIGSPVYQQLEAKSEKQKLEIIKSKQEIFDVAKAIPQKIVLKDEVRDLASYQLYNTIDFTTDELERYGNYQVVNA